MITITIALALAALLILPLAWLLSGADETIPGVNEPRHLDK